MAILSFFYLSIFHAHPWHVSVLIAFAKLHFLLSQHNEKSIDRAGEKCGVTPTAEGERVGGVVEGRVCMIGLTIVRPSGSAPYKNHPPLCGPHCSHCTYPTMQSLLQ